MVHLSTSLTLQICFKGKKTQQYKFIVYVLIMISFWQPYEHFKDDICKAWFVASGCACAVIFTNVTIRLLSSETFILISDVTERMSMIWCKAASRSPVRNHWLFQLLRVRLLIVISCYIICTTMLCVCSIYDFWIQLLLSA